MNDNLCSRICLIPLLTHSNVSKNNFLFSRLKLCLRHSDQPNPPFPILHLQFHLINRPSKLIMSHSELTKGRNENSLSHRVAETADSFTAPLPLFSLLSWSYVHLWVEDPIWRSYVLLRQVLYTLGSSVRLSSLRQHFRSSPQNQMPQDPKTYSWPCPFSFPGPWWVDPLGSPHMISWTQRPFPVEIFHLSEPYKL